MRPTRRPSRVLKLFSTSSGRWLLGRPWPCKQQQQRMCADIFLPTVFSYTSGAPLRHVSEASVAVCFGVGPLRPFTQTASALRGVGVLWVREQCEKLQGMTLG
jgi:hypothetical protein